MNTNDTILGAIEPDVAERIAQAGDEIAQGRTTSSKLMSGLAMASVPIALAALSRDAFGQANVPTSVIGVLDFALALEIFENEFYKAVLGISSSAAQNAAFTTVRAKVPAAAVASIQQIQKHEAAHVAFLSSQPGVTNAFNLTPDSFDFTGARGAGNGPFAAATTDLNFLLLTAQGAEDTGVRAYKGQAPVLMATGDTATLEYALRIHSVEARHASKIRRLRRQNGATTVKFSGTITGASAGAENISNPPAAAVTALAAIYNGEDNTSQGGITVTGLSNLPSSNFIAANAATEAFDEPLTRAAVVSIVQPFFIPTIS